LAEEEVAGVVDAEGRVGLDVGDVAFVPPGEDDAVGVGWDGGGGGGWGDGGGEDPLAWIGGVVAEGPAGEVYGGGAVVEEFDPAGAAGVHVETGVRVDGAAGVIGHEFVDTDGGEP
jgi:hypothetical protein